jgi:hypothetical protein
MTNLEEQQKDIITNLEKLNKTIEKQSSITYTVRNGLIYGAGFVIGSTILATIIISLLIKVFGDIPLVMSIFSL